MLDPSDDYGKRIEEFGTRLENAKADALKSLLERALSATSDTAAVVSELADLSERFASYAKRDFSNVHSNIENNLENAAQLNTNLHALLQDPTIDASIKKSLAVVSYQAILSSKVTAQAQLATVDLIVHSFSTVST
jgi:hypothetical protein